jgi:hypothetical protein
MLIVNSSDERLGREGEELEEVQGEEAEDEDGEGGPEAGVWDGYVDGEVGCRRRSRRDTIDGYEAFLGFGSGFGDNGRIGSDDRSDWYTMRDLGCVHMDWTGLYADCMMASGLAYEGWDGLRREQ